MRRLLVPLIVVVIAATAFVFRERWLPQPPGHSSYLGYVEGETTLIGVPKAGRIIRVAAEAGQPVKAGEPLFALDPAQATADVARAEAAAATARATRDNLLTGKREDELAVIRAQITQAEAGLGLARKEMQRTSTLTSSGTAARARLDQAAEQMSLFEGRLAELRASEKVARLPARAPEIAAANSRVAEAEAQLAAARERLSDLSPLSPADAIAADVYFKPGEWVAAGQPVVSLLQPSHVRLRFFVPQAQLALAVPGREITFLCDGCGPPMRARITRTASQPEFTPPVIYSEGARSKLVYLVEAKPADGERDLRPGLPIQVEPLQ